MCYPILGQRKLKANNVDRQLTSRKAQSSSCFDLDSDRVTVLVPRQTEVSISVWGKPSELGNSLLSTNQRPFIYTGPQALSWRPSTIRSQVGPGSRLRCNLNEVCSLVAAMVRTSKTDHFFKLAPFWSPLTDLTDFDMAGKLLTSATRRCSPFVDSVSRI